MYVKYDVGWNQEPILIRLIVREDRDASSNAERSKLSKLANKVPRIVRYDSMSVDLMKTILNLATSLQDEYTERFVATRILDIVKDMIGVGFLIEMSA